MDVKKNTKRETGDNAERNDVEMYQDQPVYLPPTDIYELKDRVMVVSDMPGVANKGVDVTLEDDVLTLTGRQDEDEPENMELLHRGYALGIYRRSFTLSIDVNAEKITAKVKNGVLTVELPKSERAKPKKITVNTG